MTTTATTERERLGLPKPGAKPTPLEKAREAFNAAIGARDELAAQERALVAKRQVLGDTLAREGKLTRVQRSELSSVNGQLKKLTTPTKRAQAAVTRAGKVLDRETEKVEARQRRERERQQAREQAAVDRKKAANERKLDRSASRRSRRSRSSRRVRSCSCPRGRSRAAAPARTRPPGRT
jgi:hypothetical protein